jgi:hypothetical protein
VTTQPNSAFQARARYEAERYGADAWVFVRELLQNARDAGAGRVWLEVSSAEGMDRVVCRDDGSGMTLVHARDYLFTLYASSKRAGPRSAGRFGIGFWSILRFAPSAITVRSRSAGHEAWRVCLDGDLGVVRQDSTRMEQGTEVMIERVASGDDIEGLLRAAVLRDAPFVTRLGHGDRRMDVRLNGEPLRAAFDLPAPSMSFRRRGLRGVVGLGSEPKVEIFAHGLRVRDAAGFDDLLLTGRRGQAGVPTVTEGLAPRALMDSSGLTVLLARSDAREDRSLRRLVAVGHRELRRLVRAELDRHARPSPAALLAETARELWSTSRPLLIAGAVTLAVLGAVAGWRWITGGVASRSDAVRQVRLEEPAAGAAGTLLPYTDIGSLYGGPDADVLGGPPQALALQYLPALERPFFAALLLTGIDPNGAPVYPPPAAPGTTGGAPCVEGCLDVELRIAGGGGILRLPVATGQVVDPNSVTLNGERLDLIGEVGGLPAVDLGDRRGGRMVYRSAPAVGTAVDPGGDWPSLPLEVSGPRDEIAALPVDARAAAAAEWVRRRVVYDASPATARRHHAEQRRGLDLFERSLLVGAGDCDVQNTLVAAILESTGVPSRLAVGWVGDHGRTQPGLHAWVEYLGSDGRWRVADASVDSGRAPPDVALQVPPARSEPARAWRNPTVWLSAGLALLLIGLAMWIGRSPAHRRFNLGDREDIAGLVRAAAVQPEAFAGIHALFRRQVVPVLGGRAISIDRARAVAGRGRLAFGGRECDLALRAAVRGTVIDRGTAVGAAAGEALGAVDLDDWQALLSRSWKDPVATRVGEVLTGEGEPYRLRIARGVGEEIAVLDGARVGLSAAGRWLVLDHASEVWRTVCDLALVLPAAAALLLADSVFDRLSLPQALHDACLAELARAALEEQAGGAP